MEVRREPQYFEGLLAVPFASLLDGEQCHVYITFLMSSIRERKTMNQPPVQVNQPYHETVYRFDPVALKAWLDNRASQGGIQKQGSESAGPNNRKGE